MKKYSMIFVVIILLSLLLTGCDTYYKTDYLKKYKSYLDYSFGEWKMVEQRNGTSSIIPISKSRFFVWELDYTGDNPFDRRFVFDNFTRKSDTEAFGFAVRRFAEGVVGDQIEAQILRKYFKEDEIGVSEYSENDSMTSAFILVQDMLIEAEEIEFYNQLIDDEKGLQLIKLTPEALFSFHPNFLVSFEINTLATTQEEMEHVQEVRRRITDEIVNRWGKQCLVLSEISWYGFPKESYVDDVQYYFHGVEYPDDVVTRKALNRSTYGYVSAIFQDQTVSLEIQSD